jgi:hypothetical protein
MNGVQFYLGLFDSEEEAIEAYENKSKSFEKSVSDSVTGKRNADSISHSTGMVIEPDPVGKKSKSKDPSTATMSYDERISILQAKFLWERLTGIYQRILIGKAVQERIIQNQSIESNHTKEVLLNSLNDEIVLLTTMKAQLEEAMTRFFVRSVSLGDLSLESNDHMSFDLGLEANEAFPVPITHLTTPIRPVHSEQSENSPLLFPISRGDTLVDALNGKEDILMQSTSLLSEISNLTSVEGNFNNQDYLRQLQTGLSDLQKFQLSNISFGSADLSEKDTIAKSQGKDY